MSNTTAAATPDADAPKTTAANPAVVVVEKEDESFLPSLSRLTWFTIGVGVGVAGTLAVTSLVGATKVASEA